MKRYFYIFLFFSLFVYGVIVGVLTYNSINFAKSEILNYIHNERINEFKTIVKENKDYLSSIAKSFANSKIVKKAYLENNPKIIKDEFSSFFNILKEKKLIKELHFFKYPVVNFLDFPSNIKIFDASKKRLDILSVETSKKLDTFFYVCAKYPGLRAVAPIFINNKMVGIVSFGMDIEVLIKRFKELKASKVAILLNNKLLRMNLRLFLMF